MIPHKALKTDMAKVYRKYPELQDVETTGKHRLGVRRNLLNLAPKGKVGAEFGVFTGMFSEILAAELSPSKLYLVDPWDKLHGKTFPRWGGYTANHALETDAAREAAKFRASTFKCDVDLQTAYLEDWLVEFDEPFLDWAYLDASHEYGFVMEALDLIDSKLKENGVIMGDDCWLHDDGSKSEVFYAVRDFTRANDYQILRIDGQGQWAMERIGKDERV